MISLADRFERCYTGAVHDVLRMKVIAKAEDVVATESDMRRALIGGMDPIEAYEKYGKF
jgi:hypothetical protein